MSARGVSFLLQTEFTEGAPTEPLSPEEAKAAAAEAARKEEQRLRGELEMLARNLRSLAAELREVLEQVPEGKLRGSYMTVHEVAYHDKKLASAIRAIAIKGGLVPAGVADEEHVIFDQEPYRTPAEVLDETEWKQLTTAAARAAATKQRAKAKRQAKRAAAKGEAGNTPA